MANRSTETSEAAIRRFAQLVRTGEVEDYSGELRLGIALSLLGAPFFLALLLRMRRGLA